MRATTTIFEMLLRLALFTAVSSANWRYRFESLKPAKPQDSKATSRHQTA